MPAMITVTLNIPEVAALVKALQPEQINDMLLTVANNTLIKIKDRVHIKGQDSMNRPIGTYSPSYMEVRTGKVPAEDGRIYNRGTDTMVILSLSRAMENDLTVQPLTDGYGVGYNNPTNYRKAKELEDIKYKKPIWLTTAEEDKMIRQTAIDYIEDAIR